MPLCPVCGNESEPDQPACRFCGAAHPVDLPAAGTGPLHREINIERGRPLVETALRIMENELARARSDKVRVVTLIHGYGSSGKGGKIRVECRRVLDHLVRQGRLEQTVAGEDLRRRHGPGKGLLRRFPGLESDWATAFANPGVTIVVL